jgi:Calcineurin-like phosphoesterase
MKYLVGDVHGKYQQYKTLLRGKQDSVCVGDMGVGFRRSGARDGDFFTNPPHAFMKKDNHRFLRGNHDNPAECKKHSQWIPDGTVEIDAAFPKEGLSCSGRTVFFCGGAYSIDKHLRTEGYNYWSDEELSYNEADKALGVYLEYKPDVVVTHDAPVNVVEHIHTSHHRFDSSFTQRYLQNMFEQHQPRLWVFGHHHTSWQMEMNGTTFRCLNELEIMEL